MDKGLHVATGAAAMFLRLFQQIGLPLTGIIKAKIERRQQEEDASRAPQAPFVPAPKVCPVLCHPDLIQCKNSHHTKQEGGNDQDHTGRPEFVIQGQPFQQEFIEGEEVASPTHEDGQKADTQYPPLMTVVQHKKADEDKENNDSACVRWSREKFAHPTPVITWAILSDAGN